MLFRSMEYKKPAIVGQVALLTLLKEFEKYVDEEIVVIVNDPALYEVIRGTSTTNNRDVLNMAKETKKELDRFPNLVIKNVGTDKVELAKWSKELQF